MTIAIQIQRTVTFFATTSFTLLFHHHSSPFCASILEPMKTKLRFSFYVRNLGFRCKCRTTLVTHVWEDQFFVIVALNPLRPDCDWLQNMISLSSVDGVWMRCAYVLLWMRHSCDYHDRNQDQDNRSLFLKIKSKSFYWHTIQELFTQSFL